MSAGPSPRPRLSNGMIAFILVDVVLVLAVVIVAFVTFRGPGAPSSPTATSTTTSSATPSATAGQDAPAPVERSGTARTFASPSGNITCTIDENGARCGIANLANDPAPVEGCDGSVGHVYVVTTAGVPEVPCVPKNEKPKKAGKKVDVLGYGEVAREFGYTCTSEEAGVTCTDDTTGRGFTLARAGGEIR